MSSHIQPESGGEAAVSKSAGKRSIRKMAYAFLLVVALGLIAVSVAMAAAAGGGGGPAGPYLVM